MALQASHSCAFPEPGRVGGRASGDLGPALQRCAPRTRSASGVQWPAAYSRARTWELLRGVGNASSDTQEPREDYRKRKEDPPKSDSARANTRQSEQDIVEPPSDAEESEEDPGESDEDSRKIAACSRRPQATAPLLRGPRLPYRSANGRSLRQALAFPPP